MSVGAGVRVLSDAVGVIRGLQATSRPTARQNMVRPTISVKRVLIMKPIVHDLASLARALSHTESTASHLGHLLDLAGSGV